MKSIPTRYTSDVTPSRAIYPSSRQSWFITLLIICKAFHCLGIFVAYDLLKTINIFTLVCTVKILAGAILHYSQRSYGGSSSLTQLQWCCIVQCSVLHASLSVMWYYGSSLCGPFRTILVTQHHDFAVIAAAGALFSGIGGPAVSRGIVMFCSGIVCLLFLDHDEGQRQPDDDQLFSSLTSWLGLSDHKLGVLLLTMVLLLQVGVNAVTKRIAQDVGGVRRLYSLTTLLEGVILIPVALILLFSEDLQHVFHIPSLLLLLFVATSTIVVNFYVDAACVQRLQLPHVARVGSVATFMWALLAAIMWQWSAPAVDGAPSDHLLSGGVLLACALFILATLGLTSSSKMGAHGSLVGYSAAGLPLYNFTHSTLHNTSRSIVLLLSSMLQQMFANNNSRRIFYFLCLNLSFTVIELLYGMWTNSLGLISDGFHMLFDCSALVMGLMASVMACWKPSRTFSYGYGRVEDLSGFINGLFLIIISLFIFTEAVTRLLDPPPVSTQRLLVVSVCGLCVNLVGIFAFRHNQAHGHEGCSKSHSHNANMEGVFLHVLADTLGSCGVIVSSLLIEHLGLYVADPVCSLLIAVLIFASVIPLLRQSSRVLLLMVPEKAQEQLAGAVTAVRSVEGVTEVGRAHLWQHSADSHFGMLHIHATEDSSEQDITQEVISIFKKLGCNHLTVQVEKAEFQTHRCSLSRSPGYEFPAGAGDCCFVTKPV